MKVNAVGDTVWAHKYSLGIPTGIKHCKNNGYVLSSSIYYKDFVSPGKYYLYITRIDSNGNIFWGRRFDGGIYYFKGNNVNQTSDNGFLLTGHIENNGLPGDIILIKLDDKGNYVLSMHETAQQHNTLISVYPNPFSYGATLKTNNSLNGSTLLIYNTYGQIVKQIENICGETIPFYRDNLPCGIYLFHLLQNGKILGIGKLTISDH
ncbi:MAG: T9SS type A sorting domain-containing protein [Bacteroidia bacterium]